MPQCSEQRGIHCQQAHLPRDPGRRSHVLPAYPLENQKVQNGWPPSSWFTWGSLSSFQINFLPCWPSFSSVSRFYFLQPLCFELWSVVLCSMELCFLMPLPKTALPREALETPMGSKFRKAISFGEDPRTITLNQWLTF